MKNAISLHADHQLDQLSAQFEHWRQHRTQPRQRIPDMLWEQAVALCADLPYTRVAKHLRLGNKDLKARLQAQAAPITATLDQSPRFVEVPPGPEMPVSFANFRIEMERPDGAQLRLCVPDTALATVVRSFLEA